MTLRLKPEEYEALRLRVMVRDNYKCRACGWRQVSVHHVIYRSQNGPDESWNLISLCESCHDAVHRSELFIEVVPPNFVGPNGGADRVIRFTRGEQ